MTVKVGSLKGFHPFKKSPPPLLRKERGTQGVRLIKIMTEAIQRVRGEIASPLARNDVSGTARNDKERGDVSLII